jgi:hypothetical protein
MRVSLKAMSNPLNEQGEEIGSISRINAINQSSIGFPTIYRTLNSQTMLLPQEVQQNFVNSHWQMRRRRKQNPQNGRRKQKDLDIVAVFNANSNAAEAGISAWQDNIKLDVTIE